MGLANYSIPVSSWTIVGSKLAPNSICSIAFSAPSGTVDDSISVYASFTGTIRVSQAVTSNYDRLYVTIKIRNTTAGTGATSGFAYKLPSNITDTSTDIPISGSLTTSAIGINTGSNTFKIDQVQVTAIEKNGSLDMTSYLINNASSSSPSLTITRGTNVGAPTSVAVSPTVVSAQQSVSITWGAASAGTSNAVAGYQVFYSDNGGNTWNAATGQLASTARNATVSGPPSSGTTRQYFVRAIGTIQGTFTNSAIVSCTYMTAGVTPPTNLAIDKEAIGTATETVTFTWTASQSIGSASGTITYYIEYSKNGGSWTAFFNTTSTSKAQSFTASSPSRAVGDKFEFRAYAKVSSYTSGYSNIVKLDILALYTCLSTASMDYYWTNDSVAIGTPTDNNGQLTLLNQFDYTAGSNIGSNPVATINTTNLRIRKSPVFNTSGTDWNANCYPDASSVWYVNKPEEYICYGGSSNDNNAKCIYVPGTPSHSNINQTLFVYASSGSYVQGGNISYGENRSVFTLNGGLVMVIKRLPFGTDATSVNGGSIDVGNWFADGSSFTELPITFVTLQSTYDTYPPIATKLASVSVSSGGTLTIGSWYAIDSSSVNRFGNLAGIATVVAVGRK